MSEHKNIPYFRHSGDSAEDCWCEYAAFDTPTPQQTDQEALREQVIDEFARTRDEHEVQAFTKLLDAYIAALLDTILADYVLRDEPEVRTIFDNNYPPYIDNPEAVKRNELRQQIRAVITRMKEGLK